MLKEELRQEFLGALRCQKRYDELRRIEQAKKDQETGVRWANDIIRRLPDMLRTAAWRGEAEVIVSDSASMGDCFFQPIVFLVQEWCQQEGLVMEKRLHLRPAYGGGYQVYYKLVISGWTKL